MSNIDKINELKLTIYEAYDNGELSYGEKEYLLEQVEKSKIDMSNTKLTLYWVHPFKKYYDKCKFALSNLEDELIVPIVNILNEHKVKCMEDYDKHCIYIPGIPDKRHPNGLGVYASEVLRQEGEGMKLSIWNDYPIAKLKKSGSGYTIPKEEPDTVRTVSVTELTKIIRIIPEKEFNSPALKKRLNY